MADDLFIQVGYFLLSFSLSHYLLIHTVVFEHVFKFQVSSFK